VDDNRKTKAETATARGHIYGLLAAVFREEPDKEFIRELKSPQFSEVFSGLGADLGDEFHESVADNLCDELSMEFTRLFLGPGLHISAHESIFVDVDGESGELWGAKTVEVKKFIETTGLRYDEQFTGLPDHISVELEFMRKLAEWEADLWIQGEIEHAQHCLTLQKMFADRHLMRWVPNFCARVIDEAKHPFYREMAKVTSDFLEFDNKSINESLS